MIVGGAGEPPAPSVEKGDKIRDYEIQKKYILKTGKLPRGVDNWQDKSEYYNYISNEIDRLKTLPDNQEKIRINSGDWVTINPAYARDHGLSNLNGKFRILSKTVKAKQLITYGDDVNEWGYIENSVNEQEIPGNKKLYYHGRNMNRPYVGNHIYITDSLGYTSGYSDGKILYSYTLNFNEDKLFSIRNKNHLNLLRKYIDDYTI